MRLLFLSVCLVLAASTTHVTGDIVVSGTVELQPNSFLNRDYMHGYDVVANQEAVVTELGFWDDESDGLSRSFIVGVWETSSQTLLASSVINNSDALDASVTVEGGQWRFESLGSGVTLQAGATYTFGFYSGSVILDADEALILERATLANSPLISVPTIHDRTNLGGSSGGFAFPANVNNTSIFRANVNAKIFAVVPEPSSSVFLGLAVALFSVTRRGSRTFI